MSRLPAAVSLTVAGLLAGGMAGAVAEQAVPVAGVAIPAGNAFADGQSAGGGNTDLLTFPPGDMSSPATVSSGGGVAAGYDFSPDGSVLYNLDNAIPALRTINQTTGAASFVGTMTPVSADTWVDLTIDPVTGAAYAASVGTNAFRLYTVNLSTGVATKVNDGVFSAAGIVDMSMNCAGELFAVGALDDTLYRVNPSTAALTAVGPLGVSVVNGPQGIDFDNASGELHGWLYLGSGTTQYSRINTSTGAATAFPGGSPTGEFEGAVRTTCSSPQIQLVSPTSRTADLRPGFAVSAAPATTAECSFDQGTPAYAPCLAQTGPGPLLLGTARPATVLAPGDWTLRVRATYRGGLTSTRTHAFTVVDCLTLEYAVHDAKKRVRKAGSALHRARASGDPHAVAKARKKLAKAKKRLKAAKAALTAEPVCG